MKKRVLILVILVFAVVSTAMGQKMTVKDSDANVLMEVNDEGAIGSIMLPQGSAPGTTTDKLYNVGGALYWNGSELGMATSSGGWTDSGTDVYLTTTTDNVGIGTTSPAQKLNVDGNLLLDGSLYFPNNPGSGLRYGSIRQGDFSGGHYPSHAEVNFDYKDYNGSSRAGLNLVVGGVNDGFLTLTTNNTERVRVDHTGNMGIGRTSPNSKLDVNGTAEMTGFKMPTGASSGYVLTSDASGVGTWQAATSSNNTLDQAYDQGGAGAGRTITADAGAVEIASTGGLDIDANTVVGASTSSTETLSNVAFSLDGDDLFVAGQAGIEGNVYTDNSFIVGSTTTYSDGSITKSSGSALNINLGGSVGDDLIVDTNTLVVESDNNRVGIGTTSPGEKLEVNGTSLFSDDMRINGNVGLNADPLTSSQNSLYLYDGDIFSEPRIEISGHNQAMLILESRRESTTDGNRWTIQSGGGTETYLDQFVIGNADDGGCFYIRDGGKVGIGEKWVKNRLDVKGAMAVGATYSGTNTAPSNGMIIQGDVAIGKTSADSELDVNGEIRSTYGFFHDRGDATSLDKTVVDWTKDGTWYDWDLSSVVPEGTKGIVIWGYIKSSGVGEYFMLRENGNSNEYNILQCQTQVANIERCFRGVVSCDANRIIEYKFQNTGHWTDAVALVVGWFK